MVNQMRHHDSPAERAKREAAAASGDSPREGAKGFRHYNHPDEIAKREREGLASSAVVAPQRQPRQPKPVLDVEGWPPAGQENTALVQTGAPAPRKRPVAPFSGEEPQRRLELLEELVYTFLEDPGQAREFRMRMSNFVAVTESQRDLIARVRSLEQTVEDLVAAAESDDDDDDEGDDEDDGEPGVPPTEPPAVDAPPPGEPATRPEVKPPTEPTT